MKQTSCSNEKQIFPFLSRRATRETEMKTETKTGTVLNELLCKDYQDIAETSSKEPILLGLSPVLLNLQSDLRHYSS